MKKLVLSLSFLLFGFFLKAQVDFEKESISILPESELIITGSTNVNKFDCEFDIALISDEKEVKFIRDDNFINFSNLKLHLLTEGFDCGNRRMNADFQDLLMCKKYPEIEIEIDRVEHFSEEYSKVYIRVQLAGKSNSYHLPVQIEQDRFIGKFRMNIRDFGLEPPKKALGLIEVDEQIEVQFNLKVEI